MKKIIFSASLWSSLCFGEYRAYELLLVNEEAGTEKPILSTLDHLQYADYFSTGRGEVVMYVDSWMCWGNTNYHKPICPKPTQEGELQDERAPAGQ